MSHAGWYDRIGGGRDAAGKDSCFLVYAVSDLHGCLGKYQRLLDALPLGETDTLYILGDVIDRGAGGIEILLDLMSRANVKPLIGNHESLSLGVMKRIAAGAADEQTVGRTKAGALWLLSDGAPTVRAFCALSPGRQRDVIDYIESFGIYDELAVNGRRFHLSHTLPDYDPGRPIHDVGFLEFLYGEPDYTKVYAPDTLFVTGHTPTGLIDPAFAGRILQKNHHIAIDCGAAFGNPLGCICLDTLEEFYFE